MNLTDPWEMRVGLPETVLIVIEPNVSALSVRVTSESEVFEKDTLVDWPSEGVLLPKEAPPLDSARDLSILIFSGVVSVLLHITGGFVWIREHRNVQKHHARVM
jgi:hypothetical protein